MPLSKQIKNQHLLWRVGFGINTKAISNITVVPNDTLYATIETASLKPPEYIDVASNTVKGFVMGFQQAGEMQQMQKPDADKRKQFRKESVKNIHSLNVTWIDEMINNDDQLREKMSLFWHGHFACRNMNIFFQQLLLNAIRTNALANFGDLLKSVSKSAAMLNFLNNQQNRKQHPNENFAREVMELFTMGRGNYTENDVKEAARAFTGWSADFNGDFIVKQFFHDNDSKVFLGKHGNFNGDDVLNIILEQPQTATFITQKIYKYFVNDEVDKDVVAQLSKTFYQSNYDIKGLMKIIFTSDWFYNEKNIGSKIKSPVELLVGMQKLLPIELTDEKSALMLQRLLGQVLFYPPNVAGWQGGKSWIDSSTLMLRMRIPQLMNDNDTVYMAPKPDDDVQMGLKENGKPNVNNDAPTGLKVNAKINWNTYIQQFALISDNNLYESVSAIVLQTNKNSLNKNVIEKSFTSNNREEYIKNTTIALMSTPEYQLC